MISEYHGFNGTKLVSRFRTLPSEFPHKSLAVLLKPCLVGEMDDTTATNSEEIMQLPCTEFDIVQKFNINWALSSGKIGLAVTLK